MDYREKLREHINREFQELPDTEENNDTREELLADLLDHYEQALTEGMEPEQAYDAALSSLGNIMELAGMTDEPPRPPHQ